MSQPGTITTSLSIPLGDPYARTRYRNVLKENRNKTLFGIKDCRHVYYLASSGHIVRALQYLSVMILDRPRATATTVVLYEYCCDMQEYYIRACREVVQEPTPAKRLQLDYYSLPSLTRRLSTAFPDRLFDIMANLPDADPTQPQIIRSRRDAALEFHRQVLSRRRKEQSRSQNVLRN